MGSESDSPIEVYFLPFSGGGHQIPMIDMARLFSTHGAKSTIIATASNAPAFRDAVVRDQHSGNHISIHTLQLQNDTTSTPPDADMSAPPLTDTSVLRAPLELLLSESPPDCIVVDAFHRWAAEAIDSLGVKRIAFNGTGCFSRCVSECLSRFKPHADVDSDSLPFVVPGLPDRIELTKSQLPARLGIKDGVKSPDRMNDSEEKSFGVLVNSFRELEPSYAECFTEEMGKKAWLVGPVSLCNREMSDKVARGSKASIDERRLLDWLDTKEPNSVVYISFGSLARVSPEQLVEIAHALESSGHPFVWVIGKMSEPGDRSRLPAGFEERMMEAKRGMIIRGWAPQLLILEHDAVGGFVTHCGWNSTLEGVCAGMAMATWPMSAEQFFNEKLVSDVVRTGVRVGSEEWAAWNGERKVVVGREKVAEAIGRLMGCGEEAVEMRKRAVEVGEMARRAVGEGGSSWMGVRALVSELRACRRAKSC